MNPAAGQARVLAVLFLGVLLGALDIAVVGPALPAMRETFAVGSRALSWVFGIYMLFYLAGAPVLAKLSDRRGRRTVYAMCIGVFAGGSLIVALAPSFPVLLAGRAVQAFGAGGIFPVASAVVADTFPADRRGRTLGMIGAVFGVAFLVGPLLGGLLLRWGWQWLFLVNLPLAAVVIVLGVRVLPRTRSAHLPPFDLLGAAVLGASLLALVWGINRIDTQAFAASLTSAHVLPFILAAFAAMPLLWLVERRAADPVLHPDLLGSAQVKLVCAIALAAGSAEAGMVFLPDMAVLGLDVEASKASLMMLPLVSTLVIGAPSAGRLLEVVGAKAVIQAGLALTVLGLLLYAWLPFTVAAFYAAGVCVGLGLSGLLGAPLRYAALREAGERRRGAGQGLLTLSLGIGQLLGAAMIGGVAAGGVTELGGYRRALLVSALVCAAALPAAFGLARGEEAGGG